MSSRFVLRPVFTRRAALVGVTGCVAALGARSALAQAGSCVVTADSGEGPFYFDANLVRSDVVDGRVGAPLDIAIKVTREDCAPLAGLRVDLWQADGLGLYSGYREQSGVGGVSVEAAAVDRKSLRGTQFADADGWVRFKTIYPSWYGGRTPHIHFKVFRGGDELVASQIFFPDEVNAEVFAQWDPYREHVAKRRVFNATDRFLDLNTDGRLDGVFCDVESNERRGFTAKALVTVGAGA
jgi:protocatechuate 3,4-dioxygenase beta subunit